MLPFERQVVTALARDVDEPQRPRVVAYVDAALRSMPEYLRAGVAAESIVLGTWPRLQRALGRLDDDGLVTWLDRLEASRIDPVRQYVRLLSSLVLFAREELATEAAP
jgi:hypothetical protein